MIIFASEDIGNADPQALQVSIAAKDAVHFVSQEHLPQVLKGKKYYDPSESSYEKTIKERMRGWEETKKGKV